jgi:hypothetical protein
MEIFGGIKPKPVLLFLATFPSAIDVCVQGVWPARAVPQEVEVDLVMYLPLALLSSAPTLQQKEQLTKDP